MAGCQDMKKGEVYVCEGCGVELEVVRECRTEETEESRARHVEADGCEVKCCDRPLKLKRK